MSTELAFLRERLEAATARLASISTKKMFGCDCFFRDGAIFAMVWKDGRIAVKLPDEASHAALRAIEGCEPWAPSGKAMGAWLLVPEAWNDDDEALRPWVVRAHAQAAARAAAKKTANEKTATKKRAR